MIDFSLTEEQRGLQRVARQFAEKEIKPIAAQYDRRPDPRDCVPWEVIKKGWELGFPYLMVPKEYGGAGGNELDVVLVTEELAVGDIGLAGSLLITNELARLILQYGNAEQKTKWLGQMGSSPEPYLMAFAATEPGCGSDFISPDPRAGIRLVAEKQGDGYLLNGTKTFITNGGLASLYMVFARTDPEKGAAEGLSAFLVPDGVEGFSIGRIEDKMGQRLLQNSELIFEDVRVPKENLLGGEGDGLFVALSFITGGGVGVGALSVGLARAAYEAARDYAESRVQGGNPIKYHQVIGSMLFDMRMKIEAARALVWKAAWTNVHEGPHNLLSAQAKVFCSDMVNGVVTDAVQIFGGYGYMRDYPVEKYMRDAKVTQIYDGTNQVLRINSIFML